MEEKYCNLSQLATLILSINFTLNRSNKSYTNVSKNVVNGSWMYEQNGTIEER